MLVRRIAFCGAVAALVSPLRAQTVGVSGTVVDERQLPVAGATVRLTGDTAVTTTSTGRFAFERTVPGRHVLTVAAVGFQLRVLELSVSRDTSLSITMMRLAITLDTVVVRPRNIRIKATAVDSATGDFLMQAQASLYPGGRFLGAISGTVVFDSVSPGPTSIVFEAFEHLPKRVDLNAEHDTSFRVKLGIDSVALRMIAVQVQRIARRSQSISMPTTSLNRDAIKREGTMSIGELIHRRAYGFIDTAACYYVDDIRVDSMDVIQLLPELVERVELFRRGGAESPDFKMRSKTARTFGNVQMIRVYTRRYVATLPRKETLPNVVFMRNGLRFTCG